jgi:hypothetical protein
VFVAENEMGKVTQAHRGAKVDKILPFPFPSNGRTLPTRIRFICISVTGFVLAGLLLFSTPVFLSQYVPEFFFFLLFAARVPVALICFIVSLGAFK